MVVVVVAVVVIETLFPSAFFDGNTKSLFHIPKKTKICLYYPTAKDTHPVSADSRERGDSLSKVRPEAAATTAGLVRPPPPKTSHHHGNCSGFLKQLRALVIKRFLAIRRDTKAWALTFILPVVFILAGLLISKYAASRKYKDEPTLTLGLVHYNKGIMPDANPLPYNAPGNYTFERFGHTTTDAVTEQTSLLTDAGYSPLPLEPMLANSTVDFGSLLLRTRGSHKASRFGAVAFTDLDRGAGTYNFIIFSNFTALHAAPTFANLINQVSAYACCKHS